jgi:hypothetical protein
MSGLNCLESNQRLTIAKHWNCNSARRNLGRRKVSQIVTHNWTRLAWNDGQIGFVTDELNMSGLTRPGVKVIEIAQL